MEHNVDAVIRRANIKPLANDRNTVSNQKKRMVRVWEAVEAKSKEMTKISPSYVLALKQKTAYDDALAHREEQF